MSTALPLLTELAERGFSLRCASEGTLRCSPKSKLTEEDSRRIKAHREDLLSLVSAQGNLLSPIAPSSPTPTKADTYRKSSGDDTGDDTGDDRGNGIVPRFVRERLERAEALGLVARFAHTFGFISIHDPTTGEWYDVATREAPPWARDEAFKRRELRKYRGITRFLSRAELEEVYREEGQGAERPDAIEEDGHAVDERGIVYADYLED